MPFKSKKQRKWMHANKPKMAKKWEKESVKEGDLGPTTKKGKTVRAVHKKSGKEIVSVDNPSTRKILKKMGFVVKEGIFSSWMVDKAVKIANKMSGNMTGAVKAIEKLKKGLSKDKKVADALRQANESVNEGLNSKGFSIINQSIKTMAINFRDLQKLVKKQDDSRMWNEVDNIRYDLNRIEKVLKNKTYNESVNEAVNPKDVESFVKKKGLKGVDLPFWKVGIDYPFYPTKFHYVRGATAKEAEKKLSTIYHRESGGKIGKAKFDDDRFLKVHKNLKESVNEAKMISIDGTKLMNFLMKRFKFSKKKAIDTMKKAGMDTSFIKEAIEPSGIMAKINKIVQSKQAAKIDGVLMAMFSASIMMRIFNAVNDKSKKDMNKGTMRQVKVILHKVMKQNQVRESVNE